MIHKKFISEIYTFCWLNFVFFFSLLVFCFISIGRGVIFGFVAQKIRLSCVCRFSMCFSMSISFCSIHIWNLRLHSNNTHTLSMMILRKCSQLKKSTICTSEEGYSSGSKLSAPFATTTMIAMELRETNCMLYIVRYIEQHAIFMARTIQYFQID